MKKILFKTAMVIFVLLGVSACGGYYKVRDLATDKIYYTKDMGKYMGSVVLKDANTGATVTL